VSAAVLALLLAAPAPGIVHARLTTASGAGGLAPAVDAARAGAGPLWIAYGVPVEGHHQMCCWDSGGPGQGGRCCPGCRLEKGEGFSTTSRDATARLEGGGSGLVLLRADQGRIGRIRLFSSDCEVDAGGLPVVFLTDASPAQSVQLLSTYVETGTDGHGSVGEGALAAIAFHADPAADQALEGFTRPARSEHLRKQAAFWLGTARGRRGYDVLARMMAGDPSPDVRAHVTFALSQSKVPEALAEMLRAAREDRSTHVRGQALFWLAQKAGEKAAAAITRAIDDDPDEDVKEKAVFALSQLPREKGVPLLIDVARRNRNREVRKKAMFWLGQSNDPRALAFIEDVLTR
jgi:HEAT repeat protein